MSQSPSAATENDPNLGTPISRLAPAAPVDQSPSASTENAPDSSDFSTTDFSNTDFATTALEHPDTAAPSASNVAPEQPSTPSSLSASATSTPPRPRTPANPYLFALSPSSSTSSSAPSPSRSRSRRRRRSPRTPHSYHPHPEYFTFPDCIPGTHLPLPPGFPQLVSMNRALVEEPGTALAQVIRDLLKIMDRLPDPTSPIPPFEDEGTRELVDTISRRVTIFQYVKPRRQKSPSPSPSRSVHSVHPVHNVHNVNNVHLTHPPPP